MRTLVALAVIQTAILVFLAAKIVGMDRTPVAATAAAATSPAPIAVHRTVQPLTAGQVRSIVAEELEKHASIAAGPAEAQPVARSAAAATEYGHQVDAVTRQIDYYRSIGNISELQMVALQTEIGRLDKGDRQKMLNQLVKAISAGEIDGEL